jgi:multidrug resistance efflux pump
MRKIAVGSVVVAAGIVSWLGWRQSRSTPFVVSGFVEADQIRVGSRVGGRVAAVHITEGERVEVGRRLFELEPFDLRSRLARATAGAAAAKAEWDRLRAGFRREEIEEARARRDLAAAALARLVSGPRAQEIEIARQHLNEARANLEWAEAENERLTKLREEDVAALRELRDTVRFLKTSQAGVAAAEQRPRNWRQLSRSSASWRRGFALRRSQPPKPG